MQKTLSIRVSAEMAEQIRIAAFHQNKKISELLRDFIEYGLSNAKQGGN